MSAISEYGERCLARIRGIKAATMAAALIAKSENTAAIQEDLYSHGKQPVEAEVCVFHEGDGRFHHLVIEVMKPEKADNGRLWTTWRELARIDVNRLALENPDIPYPGIFRLSAMVQPAVMPDDSGSAKPQSEAPEQA